jgi:hypothetical protein
MNPTRYTEVSTKASDRYQAVLTTFRGLLFAFLNEEYSSRRADELRSQAVDVGRMYFRTEDQFISNEVHQSAQEALSTVKEQLGLAGSADIQDRYAAFLENHEEFLRSEVQAQLSRDVELLVRRYREAALERHLYGSGRPSIGNDRLRFFFRDRAGRLYPSQKFVRSVWRHSLVTIGAEFFALEAADRGAIEIEVQAEPQSQWNGLRIGISLSSNETPFSDVREEVFHPQTQVTLKVVDVHP